MSYAGIRSFVHDNDNFYLPAASLQTGAQMVDALACTFWYSNANNFGIANKN